MQLKILGPAPTARKLPSLARYLKAKLSQMQPQKSLLRFAVAYAHESYEPVLGKVLRNYIKKGGNVEVIIGVDSRGTSAKALRGLMDICGSSNVFVYHNPADGTFHPKLYMLSDDRMAIIIIGSSNFTSGGFINNFEINIAIELDLNLEEEASFFSLCSKLFEEIKSSPSSRLLTPTLLQQLKTIGVLRKSKTLALESTIPTKARAQLKQYFGSTPHEGIRVRRKKIKEYSRFIMSLTRHDVSAKRGEPYFLIPIKARDENPSFWGWSQLFSPSTRGKFPQRIFNAKVIIDGKQKSEKCRLYFFKGRDEFRFKCKSVHELGQSYVNSFVIISWQLKRGERIAIIKIVPPSDPRYEKLAKLHFEIHALGKKWTYQ